jgi:hypothetical protein
VRFQREPSPRPRAAGTRLFQSRGATTDDAGWTDERKVELFSAGVQVVDDTLADEEPAPQWCGKGVCDHTILRTVNRATDWRRIAVKECLIFQLDSAAVNLFARGGSNRGVKSSDAVSLPPATETPTAVLPAMRLRDLLHCFR